MKFLVYFTAFHWDNYQGGSGKYFQHRIEVEFDGSSYLVWEAIHDKVKKWLADKRVHKQTAEYIIDKAELI